MGLFFNSLHEQNTVLFVPPIKSGFHYMNYKIIEPKDAFVSSASFAFTTLNIQGQQLPINELNKDLLKERIKQLKLREPVKKTNWIDYGDIFTDTKERIKELKLREPVKKTLFIDDENYL
jgi:hypothetical protein